MVAFQHLGPGHCTYTSIGSPCFRLSLLFVPLYLLVGNQHTPRYVCLQIVIRHIRDFVLVKEIGTGNASTVWYGFCKKTSLPLAIKTYKKRKLSALNRRQVAREIAIHSELDHPHIIGLVRGCNHYFVLSYSMNGGLVSFSNDLAEGGLVTAVCVMPATPVWHSSNCTASHMLCCCAKPMIHSPVGCTSLRPLHLQLTPHFNLCCSVCCF